MLKWFQDQNCTKQAQLIAIGGGIIQDIATFSSHVYYRGIGWTFVPTTLLSMSDSSIGAKCGINLGKYKNQLGVFQSPRAIHISTEFIKTLTDADVLSGFGEVAKLAVTGPKEIFEKLESFPATKPVRELPLLELIRASLEVKKEVIEDDEYEIDRRRILNYGHTFGHALEAITNHAVPHGAAVAWGMDLINYLSLKRGLLSQPLFDRLHSYIEGRFKWKCAHELSADALITAARRDKKVADGQVNLVLVAGLGDLRIVKTPFDQRLATEIDEYLERFNVLYRN